MHTYCPQGAILEARINAADLRCRLLESIDLQALVAKIYTPEWTNHGKLEDQAMNLTYHNTKIAVEGAAVYIVLDGFRYRVIEKEPHTYSFTFFEPEIDLFRPAVDLS